MLKAFREEHSASSLAVVAPKLEVVAPTSHTSDDVADSAPIIEAAMLEPQFGLVRLE